jgi:hypothetical protein
VLDYTIKRELVLIYGEIERQLGELSKPIRGLQAKSVYLAGDIEKIISDKYAELTDTQKNSVAEVMKVQRISTTH